MKRLDNAWQNISKHTNRIGNIPKSILWYNFSINIIVFVMACLIIFYFPYKQALSVRVYVDGIPIHGQNVFPDNYCTTVKIMEELKDAIHRDDKVILKNAFGKEYIGRVKSEADIYREEILVQFETFKDKIPIPAGEYDGKIVISDRTIWKMLISLNEHIFN